MKHIIQFLKELKENNNKPWFEANKSRYLEVKAEFETFVEGLMAGLARMDKSVDGLTLKDCTYRIYRDVRFSKNKDPYKTHMGAYVAPKGKCSGYAGYYFHIEPKGTDFIGGNLLASGLYMAPPPVLKSIREDIFANGKEFDKLVKKAKNFTLDEESKLQKLPAGFPKDYEYAEYLKLRDFSLNQHMSDKTVNSKDILDFTLTEFKKTVPYIQFLNKAINYTFEEM